MLKRKFAATALAYALLLPTLAFSQKAEVGTATAAAPAPAYAQLPLRRGAVRAQGRGD